MVLNPNVNNFFPKFERVICPLKHIVGPPLRMLMGIFLYAWAKVGLVKFDTTREHDTNLTRFWWVWVEYNRVLVISVLTRLIRLINGSYSC